MKLITSIKDGAASHPRWIALLDPKTNSKSEKIIGRTQKNEGRRLLKSRTKIRMEDL